MDVLSTLDQFINNPDSVSAKNLQRAIYLFARGKVNNRQSWGSNYEGQAKAKLEEVFKAGASYVLHEAGLLNDLLDSLRKSCTRTLGKACIESHALFSAYRYGSIGLADPEIMVKIIQQAPHFDTDELCKILSIDVESLMQEFVEKGKLFEAYKAYFGYYDGDAQLFRVLDAYNVRGDVEAWSQLRPPRQGFGSHLAASFFEAVIDNGDIRESLPRLTYPVRGYSVLFEYLKQNKIEGAHTRTIRETYNLITGYFLEDPETGAPSLVAIEHGGRIYAGADPIKDLIMRKNIVPNVPDWKDPYKHEKVQNIIAELDSWRDSVPGLDPIDLQQVSSGLLARVMQKVN